MTERGPITDDQFMRLVDRMLTVGGDWRVSMSREGTWLTYDSNMYPISEKHANVMFEIIPRKCATPEPQDKR